jgi:polyisoprenoid-binding protein YceI
MITRTKQPSSASLTTRQRMAAALRTNFFKNLQKHHKLKFTSTERQRQNGTISLEGKLITPEGRRNVSFQVTANGAVISNKFVVRRVLSYMDGLAAVKALITRRGSACA